MISGVLVVAQEEKKQTTQATPAEATNVVVMLRGWSYNRDKSFRRKFGTMYDNK